MVHGTSDRWIGPESRGVVSHRASLTSSAASFVIVSVASRLRRFIGFSFLDARAALELRAIAVVSRPLF